MCLKPYRYPHFEKEEIERQIQSLLSMGFIKESSICYVLVKKKDGSWTCGSDFRKLNVVKNKFPVPLIEDLLDELKGASFFQELDLRSGYNQVIMCEADIYKTAFPTQ